MERLNDAKVHFRQQQAYMLSVANSMIQLLQLYDLDMEAVFNGELKENGSLEMLPGLQKKEDFSIWLLNTALYIHQAMNRERDNTMKQVIREARQYILEHYQEPELSVEQICRHLHMSPAYFSTMFRKETGKTYVAYLTEVRLDKAVELLNKTDDKTYVIAAKVGYQEQNYFSYVFKKTFRGISHEIQGSKVNENIQTAAAALWEWRYTFYYFPVFYNYSSSCQYFYWPLSVYENVWAGF